MKHQENMELSAYPYVVAVRNSAQLNNNRSIRDFFDDLNFILFDPVGHYCALSKPSQIKGAYQFCTQEELDQIAPNSDWPLTSECPFVGAVIGYCLFQPWEDDFFDYLIELSLNRGLGFLGKIKDGTYFDIVAERTFTLSETVGRHGFGEGAYTLMETVDYSNYVREAIEKSLEHLGLKPSSYHAGDHQHILDGFEDDEINRIENWHLFWLNADTVTLKLWITDWEDKKMEKILIK